MSGNADDPVVKHVESYEEERAAAEAAWNAAIATHGGHPAARPKVVAAVRAAWVARGGHILGQKLANK